MWGYLVLNYLIVVLTLGLGWPWVMHRTLRLISSQLWIYGAPDGAAIAQPPDRGPRFVSAQELREVLPLDVATDALARGFLARDRAELEGIPRTVLPLPGQVVEEQSELLLMPAFGPEGAGLKLVTIVLGRGVRLWDGLESLENRFTVESVTTPSGVTHLTFARR